MYIRVRTYNESVKIERKRKRKFIYLNKYSRAFLFFVLFLLLHHFSFLFYLTFVITLNEKAVKVQKI